MVAVECLLLKKAIAQVLCKLGQAKQMCLEFCVHFFDIFHNQRFFPPVLPILFYLFLV
jgi:hypothetical protein